jgi:hypothetical protein
MRFIYKKGSKILTNKYFLYFVFIITIIYLFQLILAKKINLIILFGLISYIVFCFNKNMAIVLGVSLIITYITTLGMRVKEGFDTATASADKTAAQTTINADKTAIANNNPTLVSDKINAPASDSTSGTLSNIVNNAKSKIQSTLGTTTEPTTTEPVSTESMNVMSNKKRNRIDYASTVQDAYEDLNSMLGEDGIKGLTLDTNKLIEQQAQLASAMKNMTPLVKTAKELLNGFNFEGMNDISNMAKQFMPSK